MGFYIALDDGQYYEGDTPSFPYKDVPQREHSTDQWVNEAWIAGLIPIPQSVTPRQARLALLAAGLLDQVNAAATTMGAEAQINWFFADSIDRNNLFLATMAKELNLSDAQIDALFISAAGFL